ncbi:glycosyltransferase [Streptosporangium sp. NPDC002721]|uniref:glycosyltransferase n=1 Tax=Streptosporangium sp. NPDC002721 TaxID=3366188 RepID=UPI00369D879B
MIQAVGVVVPARDEEELLPACLASVDLAGRMVPGVEVHLIVVADTCADRTASLAARAGATVVEGTMTNVGRARLAGTQVLLRRTRDLDPATVWVATTDADTLVPPCWLVRQLRHASQGWEAVVGTVVVTDWSGYPPRFRTAYTEGYATGTETNGTGATGVRTSDENATGTQTGDGNAVGGEVSGANAAGGEAGDANAAGGEAGDARWHPHVHGANLGVSAAAYLAVGGFSALPTGEDDALVRALESAGRRVLRTTGVSVVTSARRDPRAPDGFGHFLARLERDTALATRRASGRTS